MRGAYHRPCTLRPPPPPPELLIKSKAQTGGVPAIKGAVTCPDCKRIIAQYAL